MTRTSFVASADVLRSGHVLRLLTRRLFEPAGCGVVPDLAQTRPTLHNGGISEDRRAYRIRLRRGVFWDAQCPRELVAADVARGLKRIAHPTAIRARSYLTDTIEGMREYCDEYDAAFGGGEPTAPDLAQFQLAAVPGISVPDPATVELRLSEPAGDFLHILATGIAAAAPREYDYYRPDSHELYRNSPSAGPFRVAAGSRASRQHPPAHDVVLEPNPRWDAATDPVDRAWSSTVEGSAYGLLYLAINERRGVPASVRRAVALGVDRLAVRDAAGATGVYHGLILPGALGHGGATPVTADGGDPDRARELAGTPLCLDLLADDSTTQRRIVGALSTALAGCGITLRASHRGAGERDTGDWHLALHAWFPAWLGVNGRTAVAPLVHTEGHANHGRFGDRTVDRLIADALHEHDDGYAGRLWREVEERVLTDLPLVPLAAWTDPDGVAGAYPTVNWTAPSA